MNLRWEYIAELANIHGWKKGVELGVKEGKFSSFILDRVEGSEMVCVDLWKSMQAELEEYKNMDIHYREALARLAPYEGRYTILRMDTADAAEHVDSADFVFIDADHSYRGAMRDIEAWRNKAPVICGHDINMPSVERAVKEAFGEYTVGPNNVWLVM